MYYQEINLYGDQDMTLSKLWSKVYTQLHLVFATSKNIYGKERIGISFPEYNDKGFGRIIRLFSADKTILETADIKKSLTCYLDYVLVSDIQPLPNDKNIKYIMYCRYHPDESPRQKARRFAMRHEGVAFDEALLFMKTRKNKVLPYTRMYSMTTSQRFKLIVERRESENTQLNTDEYTSYGLSYNGSVVPEW